MEKESIMNKFVFPDNKNTIVNFSSSILNHFGVKPFHHTIKEVDDVLKGHKKVVAILFDGLGKNILEKHLSNDSFILSHKLIEIDATFPPTTVASTDGFLSGKYPNESGWMGWSQYFKSLNQNIDVFRNQISGTDDIIQTKSGRLLLDEVCHYDDIAALINKTESKAYILKEYPIDKNGFSSFEEAKEKLNEVLNQADNVFCYLYFTSPDHEIHENGINSNVVHKKIIDIQEFVESIVKSHEDTLFFTFADHGLINVKYIDLDQFPDIENLLERRFSLESRAASFKVKKGKEKEFETKFNEYFSKHFVLLNKEEIIKSNLFGTGLNNQLFNDFIGDYIAISEDEYSFYYSSLLKIDDTLLKAHHAGGTKEERTISLCVYNK